jgi:hypothetical protein
MQPCFELCSSVCEGEFLDAEPSTGLIEPHTFFYMNNIFLHSFRPATGCTTQISFRNAGGFNFFYLLRSSRSRVKYFVYYDDRYIFDSSRSLLMAVRPVGLK